MNIYDYNLNNNNIEIKINRTTIIIISSIKHIISFFDLKYYNIENNKLCLYLYNNTKIYIKGNNIKNIYDKINEKIKNLNYDFKICDLIINNNNNICKDFICSICLDNNKNIDIVKLKCCNNYLHYKCYLEFLKSNKIMKCPLCRNTKCPICLGKGC